MPYTTLLTAQDADGIVVATINRPDKLNALNDAVITDLAALATWARADDAVRAVVLTGAGEKAFVAGADIAEIAQTDGTASACQRRAMRRSGR
jgi:enoyl-CoA hydratase